MSYLNQDTLALVEADAFAEHNTKFVRFADAERPLQTTRDLQVAHRRYPKPVQTGRIIRSTIPPTRESNPIPTV